MPPPSRTTRRSLLPVIALLAVVLAALTAWVALDGGPGDPARSPVAAAVDPAAAPRPGARASVAAGSPADRTATWRRRGAAARAARVPILMWHVVAVAPPGTPYPDLWVSPAAFASQVAALRRARFTAITMRELWAAWHGSGALPAHPIVLSFDDGDLSHATHAAPVLRAADWPGVLNLAVNHLGPRGLPMWAARRLVSYGWEIDSHTVDHLDLTTLDDAALAHQLVASRRLIRQRLGVDTRFFCYPAGRNDARVRAAVARAGYVAATTVAPGIASPTDDPLLLPRIRVGPSTTPAALVEQARGTSAAPVLAGPA